jgi:hypothetical protein
MSATEELEMNDDLTEITMPTFDEIVRLATLANSIVEEDDPRGEAYCRDLAAIGIEARWVIMASKLLAGKPYCVVSDNPESIARAKSLAQHMGAIMEERGNGELHGINQPTFMFYPPSPQ